MYVIYLKEKKGFSLLNTENQQIKFASQLYLLPYLNNIKAIKKFNKRKKSQR